MRVINRNLRANHPSGKRVYRGQIVKNDNGTYTFTGETGIFRDDIAVTIEKPKGETLAVAWTRIMHEQIDAAIERAANFSGTYVVARGLKAYQHKNVTLPEGVDIIGYDGGQGEAVTILFVPNALGSQAVTDVVTAIKNVKDVDVRGRRVTDISLFSDAYLADHAAGDGVIRDLAHAFAVSAAEGRQKVAGAAAHGQALRDAAEALNGALAAGDAAEAARLLVTVKMLAAKVEETLS